jgi:hypothetical protein
VRTAWSPTFTKLCGGVDSGIRPAAAPDLTVLATVCARVRQHWFASRISFATRVGLFIIQGLGRFVLGALFFGDRDSIQVETVPEVLQIYALRYKQTFWQTVKPRGSLDRVL